LIAGFILTMPAGSKFASFIAPVLAAYDESKALTYAYLCSASACSSPEHSNENLLNWKCGAACDAVPGVSNVFIVNKSADDAFVYGGKITNAAFARANQCFLTFRGTSNTAGWIQDFKSLTLASLPDAGIPCSHGGKSCNVGSGFLTNYLDLAKGIKSNLKRIGCDTSEPLAITGHSLGASEAAIAMYDLKNEGYDVIESYTFGQPRTGDANFAAAFEAAFGNIEPFRITHSNDPIVQTPFTSSGFQHITTEVYYKDTSDKGYVICKGGEDKNCADSRSSEFFAAGLVCATNPAQCAHLTYLQPEMKTRMDGSSCASVDTLVV
jgi:PPE-repeat protein